MHGLIHLELERFAQQNVTPDVWKAVVAEAGLEGREYSVKHRYDDGEALALVVGLAKVTARGPQAVLEDFGAALAPTLVSGYSHLLEPGWTTLDLVENTEALIHTALRDTDPNARPPLLRTLRRNQDELIVVYASARQMCGVAKGLIRGISELKGERMKIEEESCMLAGAASCTLAVSVLGSEPPNG